MSPFDMSRGEIVEILNTEVGRWKSGHRWNEFASAARLCVARAWCGSSAPICVTSSAKV